MLNDFLKSLQEMVQLQRLFSYKKFRLDFIRSCGFRDIKRFEHAYQDKLVHWQRFQMKRGGREGVS